jgi:hypothetical protein
LPSDIHAPPPVDRTEGGPAQEPLDHLRLLFAKEGLAVAFEYLRDGQLRAGHDLGIGILHGNAQPCRQRTAHRGLARTHHSDQNDRRAQDKIKLWRAFAHGRKTAFSDWHYCLSHGL